MAKVKLPIYQRTQLVGGDFGTGDPYWDNTKLLLPFDVVKGSLTSISDLSQTNNTATLTGSPPPSVDQNISRFPAGPHGPTGSLLLNGGHVQFASSSNWHPDTAFTIELDAILSGGSPVDDRAIISRGNTTDGWQLVATSSKVLSLQTFRSGVADVDITGTTSVEGSPAVWKNITVSRDGSGVWRSFVGGTLQGQQTEGSPTFADAGNLYIGRSEIDAGGDANWTDVDLQISFGSPLVDESLQSRTLTLNSANTTVSSEQARFGTYSVKNTGTTGGGLRIDDASSTCLIFAADFTIEFWMYLTATTEFSFSGLVTRVDTSARTTNSRTSLEIGSFQDLTGSPNPGERVSVNAFNTNSASGQTLPGTIIVGRNRWHHIALTRETSGSPQDQLRLFVNGQLSDSRTVSGSPQSMNLSNSSWPMIGASGQNFNSNTRHNMNGYIDEVRITDGVARYTESFTPPTQEFAEGALTAVTNLKGNVDNVRITKGTARYTENFTPPKAPHPNYKKRGPATGGT